MYGSVFFSILFFVMLITLGLDSTVSTSLLECCTNWLLAIKFGGLEAMITGLCDNYPQLLRRNRKVFVAVLIAFIYLCALPTTTHVSWHFAFALSKQTVFVFHMADH